MMDDFLISQTTGETAASFRGSVRFSAYLRKLLLGDLPQQFNKLGNLLS